MVTNQDQYIDVSHKIRHLTSTEVTIVSGGCTDKLLLDEKNILYVELIDSSIKFCSINCQQWYNYTGLSSVRDVMMQNTCPARTNK